MSRLTTSDLVWAAWLLLFLVLELTAVFNFTPWDTLSQTSWLNEMRYPWLKPILVGFLIGLVIHIGYQTGLWRTTIFGILIAAAIQWLL